MHASKPLQQYGIAAQPQLQKAATLAIRAFPIKGYLELGRPMFSQDTTHAHSVCLRSWSPAVAGARRCWIASTYTLRNIVVPTDRF
jgi:hypothetical protein